MKVTCSFKMVMISLENAKFLILTPHYNCCIVHWCFLSEDRQTTKDGQTTGDSVKWAAAPITLLANLLLLFWKGLFSYSWAPIQNLIVWTYILNVKRLNYPRWSPSAALVALCLGLFYLLLATRIVKWLLQPWFHVCVASVRLIIWKYISSIHHFNCI